MRRLLLVLLLAASAFQPAVAQAQGSFVGVLDDPTSLSVIARFDAATLVRSGAPVQLGEYHGSSSVSPDGRRIAFGLSAPATVDRGGGRVGIRIVDARTLATVREVQTGIVAELVAWVAPDRIVAVLQSGRVVLVDAGEGRVLRSRPTGANTFFPRSWARVGSRLAAMLPGGRLLVADRTGAVRSVRIPGAAADTPLAADSRGGRVFAAAARVIAVDLASMRLRRVPRRIRGQVESAHWLHGAELAISTGAGLSVLDPSSGRRRSIDATARHAQLAGDRLVAWGGRGLRIYDARGRRRHTVLASATIRSVRVAGDAAYVSAGGMLRAVDTASGRVTGTLRPAPALREAIAP